MADYPKLAKATRDYRHKAAVRRPRANVPYEVRCHAIIPWGDGETSQCCRRKVDGEFCRQHAKMLKQ